MLPDEQGISTFLHAAVRRARRLTVVETVAWATAAAAVAAAVSLWLRFAPSIAVATCALVACVAGSAFLGRYWRARTSRRAVVSRIEQAEPSLRNLLVTADELLESTAAPAAHRHLHASPHVRRQVFADAGARVRSIALAPILPSGAAFRAATIAAALWLAVGTAAAWMHSHRHPPTSGARPASVALSPKSGADAALTITATVRPPAYTRLGSQTLVDPAQIPAVEGSALTLAITTENGRIAVTHDDAAATVVREADGRFATTFVVTKTGFAIVSTADGRKRIVPIVVTPDALPVVKLTVPGRDLIYSGGNPRITFEARATDDFGLRDLTLQYTKVSGSGEQFEFKSGEIPLTVKQTSTRDWRGSAARALADLNLADGDMLVYRAVASDARSGDGRASSDAFFIEISKFGAAAGDSFTLPEEETRYALSQQMLIVKTERLIQRQASMTPADVAEAALNLAVEQRMIRAEFVFMLGGEVQDEEVEAQESTELQEGRQQNRGQRDVRDATQAMSLAGKYLTGAQLTPALAAERAAVAALQRAFSKDRYILRALATRNPLDMSRRLTGDLSQASDWRRRVADVPANRRAARLQDLLKALGALGRSDTIAPLQTQSPRFVDRGESDDNTRRAEALVLAEQALRIDPDSGVLRQASADLQHVADTWTTAAPGSRDRAIERIAAQVAGEAMRAMSAAPARLGSPVSKLRGAFADALQATRSQR